MGRMGAIKFVYLLLLLLKEVGNIRLGESDLHHNTISPKNPAVSYCFIRKQYIKLL